MDLKEWVDLKEGINLTSWGHTGNHPNPNESAIWSMIVKANITPVPETMVPGPRNAYTKHVIHKRRMLEPQTKTGLKHQTHAITLPGKQVTRLRGYSLPGGQVTNVPNPCHRNMAFPIRIVSVMVCLRPIPPTTNTSAVKARVAAHNFDHGRRCSKTGWGREAAL